MDTEVPEGTKTRVRPRDGGRHLGSLCSWFRVLWVTRTQIRSKINGLNFTEGNLSLLTFFSEDTRVKSSRNGNVSPFEEAMDSGPYGYYRQVSKKEVFHGFRV